MKVTNVQPGMINTDMIHGIFDGVAKIYKVSEEMVASGNQMMLSKQHKMLAVEDVAGKAIKRDPDQSEMTMLARYADV